MSKCIAYVVCIYVFYVFVTIFMRFQKQTNMLCLRFKAFIFLFLESFCRNGSVWCDVNDLTNQLMIW